MPGLGLRLDRKFDTRNLAFKMADAVDAVDYAKLPKSVYWLGVKEPFDQGETGTCGGHAGEDFLLTDPVVQKKRDAAPTRWDIYRAAVLLDEFSENDHEATLPDGDSGLEYGTSTLAIAKALKNYGFISGYDWGWDVDTISRFVRMQTSKAYPLDIGTRGGPVILGTAWHQSMFDPDSEGYIKITPGSPIVGGHLYLVDGANDSHGRIRILNSWGQWGKGGRAYMSYETLHQLMSENGEAVTARELLIPTKGPHQGMGA